MGEKGQPNAAAVAGQSGGNVVATNVASQAAGATTGRSAPTAGQSTSTAGGEKGQTVGLSDLSQEVAQIGMA